MTQQPQDFCLEEQAVLAGRVNPSWSEAGGGKEQKKAGTGLVGQLRAGVGMGVGVGEVVLVMVMAQGCCG